MEGSHMEKTAECRVSDALNIIVGKWKAIIPLHLFEIGTMRFNELKRRIPRISQKNAHTEIT
jgi:DNA-binding HxlR family transcriptional regulator